MTGHFKTADGCEAYQAIQYPPLPKVRRPYRYPTVRGDGPMTGWMTEYGYRVYELYEINGTVAEYREVKQ